MKIVDLASKTLPVAGAGVVAVVTGTLVIVGADAAAKTVSMRGFVVYVTGN